MCEKEIVKSKRCGKYSFKLAGKGKTYFKDTTLVDFAPISKTYLFSYLVKKFKKKQSFQLTIMTKNTLLLPL